jgi:hypothetical protein
LSDEADGKGRGAIPTLTARYVALLFTMQADSLDLPRTLPNMQTLPLI